MKIRIILLCILATVSLAGDKTNLTTTAGITYTNCTITRVEPDGLTLMTKSGVVKIRFMDLPDAVRAEFDYKPAKAAQYAVKISEARAEAVARQRGTKEIEAFAAKSREVLNTISQNMAEEKGGAKLRMKVESDIADLKDLYQNKPDQFFLRFIHKQFALDEHGLPSQPKRIGGKVLQITGPQDVLLSSDDGEIYAITGFDITGYTDGTAAVFAVKPEATVYTYTSVLGASKTIKKYSAAKRMKLEDFNRLRECGVDFVGVIFMFE